MKKSIPFLLTSAFLVMLSGCSGKSNDISLELNKKTFNVMNWKVDNSHTEVTKGKIMEDKSPVEGVKVKIGERTVITNANGEFSVSVNKNIMGTKEVTVVNVDDAKINGKELNKEEKEKLLKLKDKINVYFPIKVDGVTENKNNKDLVDVQAHAVLNEREKYPNFTIDKHKVAGTVKDANGKPVKNAVVNLRRDGVEGFSMSTPSDENGKYTMYYLPEDDENHYFYVHYDNKNYTLPDGKVYQFPEDISVNIDITLPKSGTIIDDKPPTLVTSPLQGALYKGTLIGINVDKKVNYTVTIPKQDGSFVLTLPKLEWDKHPTFFETSYKGYLAKTKKAGDKLDGNFIPEPKKNEPNNISIE